MMVRGGEKGGTTGIGDWILANKQHLALVTGQRSCMAANLYCTSKTDLVIPITSSGGAEALTVSVRGTLQACALSQPQLSLAKVIT